jgi:TPR repeat protein
MPRWAMISAAVLAACVLVAGSAEAQKRSLGSGGEAEGLRRLEARVIAVRQLAEQGNADAQVSLGVIYIEGRGAPKAYVEAYKWFNLAAAADDAMAGRNRDRVMHRMTPAQIEEGQRHSAEWRPTNGP